MGKHKKSNKANTIYKVKKVASDNTSTQAPKKKKVKDWLYFNSLKVANTSLVEDSIVKYNFDFVTSQFNYEVPDPGVVDLAKYLKTTKEEEFIIPTEVTFVENPNPSKPGHKAYTITINRDLKNFKAAEYSSYRILHIAFDRFTYGIYQDNVLELYGEELEDEETAASYHLDVANNTNWGNPILIDIDFGVETINEERTKSCQIMTVQYPEDYEGFALAIVGANFNSLSKMYNRSLAITMDDYSYCVPYAKNGRRKAYFLTPTGM